MKHCTQCGHVLGLGRFCTNCGHPVAARHADPLSDPLSELTDPDSDPLSDPFADPADHGGAESAGGWRTDTAERPSRLAGPAPRRVAPAPAEPRLPPPGGEAPPPPRFPLFADEVDAPATATSPDRAPTPVPAPAADPAPAVTTAVPSADGHDEHSVVEDRDEDWDDEDWDDEDWDDEDWDDRRRPRAVWVVGAAALLAVLVVGGWLLGRALGGDDDPATEPSAGNPSDPGQEQEPVDHTAAATAQAPRTAPSTEDVDGNPTSYAASNMLDGVPETAWRAAGDGSGLKLVFTFPQKTRIAEVGLVNGYAKTATDDAGTAFDWYAGHRRITQVTWNFGAGDVVRQDLAEDRALQTVGVGPVEVRKVVLKIVTTTEPGQGPAQRDFTAISDVFLAG